MGTHRPQVLGHREVQSNRSKLIMVALIGLLLIMALIMAVLSIKVMVESKSFQATNQAVEATLTANRFTPTPFPQPQQGVVFYSEKLIEALPEVVSAGESCLTEKSLQYEIQWHRLISQSFVSSHPKEIVDGVYTFWFKDQLVVFVINNYPEYDHKGLWQRFVFVNGALNERGETCLLEKESLYHLFV